MMGVTHSLAAAAVAQMAQSAGLLSADAAVMATAVLGGLLPDIDHPGSMIGRRFPPLALIAVLLGHRGPTHSMFAAFCILITTYVLGLAPGYALALLLGYASHLALDWLTPSGIPLAWPFHSLRFASPITFRTGGLGELVLAALALFALVLMWN